MSYHSNPRGSDERMLLALQIRSEGGSVKDAARATGYGPETLSAMLLRVVRADIKESGEPRDTVLGQYWEGVPA